MQQQPINLSNLEKDNLQQDANNQTNLKNQHPILQDSHLTFNNQSPITYFLSFCKKAIWFSLLFSFFISIFTLASSIYSMQVLDRVLSSNSSETLLYLTIIVLAFL